MDAFEKRVSESCVNDITIKCPGFMECGKCLEPNESAYQEMTKCSIYIGITEGDIPAEVWMTGTTLITIVEFDEDGKIKGFYTKNRDEPNFLGALEWLLGENRFVYGTKDEKWYCITPEDRDYEQAITYEQLHELGFEECKDLYLAPMVI